LSVNIIGKPRNVKVGQIFDEDLTNFGRKIKILVKNQNFGQKSKFWSKIKILVKNQNFGQKSKFWSKI